MAHQLFTAIATVQLDSEKVEKVKRQFLSFSLPSSSGSLPKAVLSARKEDTLKTLIRTTVIAELSIHFPLVHKARIAKDAVVFVTIFDYFMNNINKKNANTIFVLDENNRGKYLLPLLYPFWNYFDILVSIYLGYGLGGGLG